MGKRDANIFVRVSVRDPECNVLSKRSPDTFVRDSMNNLVRISDDISSLQQEMLLYIKLCDKHLFPKIEYINKTMIYKTQSMMSLHSFLNKHKINITLLHDLFSFVNTFRKYKFVHGDLSLHKIYIDPSKTLNKFVVIDLSTSFLVTDKTETDWQYIDFFKIYIELKQHLRKTVENIHQLERLITTYIPEATLDLLLKDI